jgi:hypothetical protein
MRPCVGIDKNPRYVMIVPNPCASLGRLSNRSQEYKGKINATIVASWTSTASGEPKRKAIKTISKTTNTSKKEDGTAPEDGKTHSSSQNERNG